MDRRMFLKTVPLFAVAITAPLSFGRAVARSYEEPDGTWLNNHPSWEIGTGLQDYEARLLRQMCSRPQVCTRENMLQRNCTCMT